MFDIKEFLTENKITLVSEATSKFKVGQSVVYIGTMKKYKGKTGVVKEIEPYNKDHEGGPYGAENLTHMNPNKLSKIFVQFSNEREGRLVADAEDQWKPAK